MADQPPHQKPTAPSNQNKSSNPKKHRPILWGSILGTALLSLAAGMSLAALLSQTSFMKSQPGAEDAEVFDQSDDLADGSSLQIPQLSRPINVLLLGTKVLTSDLPDATESPEGYHALVNSLDGLADTMLLLRFDPDTQQLVVLSIPRDTRTRIAGYGVNKINAANAHGGPSLAATTVSRLLEDVAIDRYVRINVQGVEELVDALGGVTVYVPKDMKYRDDSQHFYVDLEAGEQHLNGDQSLQFLRFRYGEFGDIGRVRRQQLFMQAMLKQVLKPSTVLRLPQLFSVVQENLDTNLSNEELIALANFASQVERSQIQMLMLPGRFSTEQEYRASYWLPDQERIQVLMGQYFDVEANTFQAIEPSALRVAIQPDANQAVAVEPLIQTLSESGYQHIRVAAPYYRPLNHTRIVAQNGDRLDAEAVRQVLGVGKVRVENTGDFYSDITIQLGQDWSELKDSASSPPHSYNYTYSQMGN